MPLQQFFFEGTRLRIAAIQDRRIATAAPLAHPLTDAIDHIGGLVHFGVGRIQIDVLTFAGIGPQLLAQPVAVMRDHRIGGIQDGAGGTVILFKANGVRTWKITQEPLHVLHLRTAPTIDGLVVITHHKDVPGAACQQPDKSVLDGIGVLKLVHQNLPETMPVMRQQRRGIAQQFMRTQQQFGKVHQACALAALFIGGVHTQLHIPPWVMRGGLDMLRAATFVLLRVDPPGQLARRKLAIVQFQLLHHALDQPQLVVAVQHLKPFRQLRLLPVQAQQAMGQAVEGADPRAARLATQLRGNASAHLAGGFVGEGDRQDAVQRHPEHLMQPCDAMGQHTGFAGTGPGQHQIMAGCGRNGFALGRVQPIKQVGNIHPPDFTGSGGLNGPRVRACWRCRSSTCRSMRCRWPTG